jgi:hypothetical protein
MLGLACDNRLLFVHHAAAESLGTIRFCIKFFVNRSNINLEFVISTWN